MKISFVVAAYNIQNYIRACIDSIIHGSLPSDEIIIVNDGSTDQTEDIIRSSCLGHNNIHLINKENGGLSSARNAGLTAANGDYVLFLDGDDVLIPEYFKVIRGHLNEKQPDILITDYLSWLNDGMGPLCPSPRRCHALGVVGVDPRMNLQETFDDCIPCVWTRLIRRTLFEKLPLSPFPESLMYDDLPTTPHLTAVAKSLLYISIPMVQYRSRADSLTKLRTHRSCTDMVIAAQQAASAIDHLPYERDLAMAADRMLVRKTMEAIRQCRETESPTLNLYLHVIRLCLSGIRSKPKIIAADLLRTKNRRDSRISRHLVLFSLAPKSYALVQLMLACIKNIKRSKLKSCH